MTLEIYGDGKLLYTFSMYGGVEPSDFNVNLSGVLELKIVMYQNLDGKYNSGWRLTENSAISNCGLYT